LFQLYKDIKLNLLEEYFGVIRSREFDMGNVGLNETNMSEIKPNQQFHLSALALSVLLKSDSR